MTDPYAPTKALRHLDIVEATRRRQPARPAHVHLVISDVCNQRCRYCAYREVGYPSSQRFLPADGSPPRRMLPAKKVREILDDCARLGCRAIQYTGGGEPATHPDLDRLLEYTASRGLHFSVVSNGVLLDRDVGPLPLADWVRISLDAADAKTYAAIRGVPESHFDHAWATVERLRLERDRRGTACVVGVGCIVTADNWQDVRDIARLARERGADNISLAPQYSVAGLRAFDGFLSSMVAECEAAEQEGRPGFAVINRVPGRLGELRQGRPARGLCGYQIFTPYIGADQNVYRCCVLAYNDRGLVGNLVQRRFAELWMAPERCRGMLAFDARLCDRCPYQTQNALLADALAPEEPLHADFV